MGTTQTKRNASQDAWLGNTDYWKHDPRVDGPENVTKRRSLSTEAFGIIRVLRQLSGIERANLWPRIFPWGVPGTEGPSELEVITARIFYD